MASKAKQIHPSDLRNGKCIYELEMADFEPFLVLLFPVKWEVLDPLLYRGYRNKVNYMIPSFLLRAQEDYQLSLFEEYEAPAGYKFDGWPDSIWHFTKEKAALKFAKDLLLVHKAIPTMRLAEKIYTTEDLYWLLKKTNASDYPVQHQVIIDDHDRAVSYMDLVRLYHTRIDKQERDYKRCITGKSYFVSIDTAEINVPDMSTYNNYEYGSFAPKMPVFCGVNKSEGAFMNHFKAIQDNTMLQRMDGILVVRGGNFPTESSMLNADCLFEAMIKAHADSPFHFSARDHEEVTGQPNDTGTVLIANRIPEMSYYQDLTVGGFGEQDSGPGYVSDYHPDGSAIGVPLHQLLNDVERTLHIKMKSVPEQPHIPALKDDSTSPIKTEDKDE